LISIIRPVVSNAAQKYLSTQLLKPRIAPLLVNVTRPEMEHIKKPAKSCWLIEHSFPRSCWGIFTHHRGLGRGSVLVRELYKRKIVGVSLVQW